MAIYRSAMGKTVDMAALSAKNEKVRAVGNMSVNARGDTIDASGKTVVSATTKASNRYQKTVGNRSANVLKNQPVKKEQPRELTKAEIELEESFVDDIEVEAIKSRETRK